MKAELKIEINLNDIIEFALSEEGAKIYNSFCGTTHNAGENIKLQLWSFMNIFGKHLQVGSFGKVPAVNNVISINQIMETNHVSRIRQTELQG